MSYLLPVRYLVVIADIEDAVPLLPRYRARPSGTKGQK